VITPYLIFIKKSMNGFKCIVYDKAWYRHSALIAINNPQQHNSYTIETLREMCSAFEDAMWDDAIQFIVLTGVGDKAFCTGGNVHEYAEQYTRKPSDFWKWGEVYGRVFHFIRHCGKPVIARVNGVCAGGGFEFVCASDLAVASTTARFLSPGPRVGMTSIGGLSQWLPLHTSIKKAAEIVMLSQEISAEEALTMGIVNKVVPPENLDTTIKEMIDRMLMLSPSSLHYYKVHLNWWRDLVWDLTWEHAKEWFSLHIGSVEPAEGLWAFKNKRERRYPQIRERMAQGMDTQFPHGPLMKACPKCGADFLPDNSEYCLKCGAKL